MHPINDDTADAARMFELMQSQRRTTRSRLERSYTWLLVVWAAAWAIGFGALWFARDIGGVPIIPTPVAAALFGGCLAAAIVWSIVTGVRSAGSGIRGRSQLQGALYGWSWTISMVGVWLFTVGLQRAGVSVELAAVLYPGIFVLMVGVLYLSGGALWRAPVQYVLGIVIIAVAIGATLAGAPYHYLAYATAGPIALLVVAVLMVRGVVPAEPRERPQTAEAHEGERP